MDRLIANVNALGGILIALACVCASAAYADEPSIDQQVQMLRTLTDAERQATMAANVILTPAESEKFWPMYREYRNEINKINDKTIAQISKLGKNIDNLSDADAKTITDSWLDTEKQRIALKAKYIHKYAKVLSAVKTARVLQIENKLDALVRVGLARAIPLVTPPAVESTAPAS